MSQQPFDPNSQASRALAEEEQRLARQINTRASLTEVISPSGGGRFATALRQQIDVVQYPRLPSNSPWSQIQPPPEEPLGFSVEDMPVMGEPFEVERAAEILAERADAVGLSLAPASSPRLQPVGLSTVGPSATDPLPVAPVATEAKGSGSFSSSTSDGDASHCQDEAHPSALAPATSKGEGARGIEPVLKGGTFHRRFG
jgi:hypothetical protein